MGPGLRIDYLGILDPDKQFTTQNALLLSWLGHIVFIGKARSALLSAATTQHD